MLVLLLLLLLAAPFAGKAQPQANRNVLLLIVDDLRWTPLNINATQQPNTEPFLGGTYDGAPNLERFKEKATTFDFAFAQIPWCGPSRSAFLSGREGVATGVVNNDVANTRRLFPKSTQFETLPQFFKTRGYRTYSAGKVFHGSDPESLSPQSWTQVLLRVLANSEDGSLNKQSLGYKMVNCMFNNKKKRMMTKPKPFTFAGRTLPNPGGGLQCHGIPQVALDTYDDFVVAQAAMDKLAQLAQERATSLATWQPFFMAVGFYRPHLPYSVHDTYWNLFPSNLDLVAPPLYTTGPEPRSSMPAAFYPSANIKNNPNMKPVFGTSAPTAFTRAVRVGYAAAISQTDAALGRVLDTLDHTNFTDSTLVIFVADHGFILGESNMWHKKTLTDHATHVPFLLYVPWLAPQQPLGLRRHVNHTFVELLDVYRTLADACGLELPTPAQFTEWKIPGVAGKSLVPLYLAATTSGTPAVNATLYTVEPAFSLVPRCLGKGCTGARVTQVGFSVRTPAWRYNVWLQTRVNGTVINWTGPRLGEELYNKTQWQRDEDHFNIQALPEFAGTKAVLFSLVRQRFQGTYQFYSS